MLPRSSPLLSSSHRALQQFQPASALAPSVSALNKAGTKLLGAVTSGSRRFAHFYSGRNRSRAAAAVARLNRVCRAKELQQQKLFSSAAASATSAGNGMVVNANSAVVGARPDYFGKQVEDLEKPLEDHRSYRYWTLPNGIQACVVSDPKCDKAAACLSVRVGSLFEPKTIPGLAHFCEHMLFLGTKKYPKEDDYNEFLAKNGGHSNAFTAGCQTVYYFDVGKEHLEPALDRFSRFFIDPLFTESATERELKAVHSEHTKNMQSDRWRRNQLMKNQFTQGHPLHGFSTGNLETLLETPKQEGMDLRQELLDFHAKYYSSNVMTMSLLGYQPLEELQAMVEEKFAEVVNKDVDIPRGAEIGKGIDPIPKGTLGTELRMVPVKDEKSVSFEFLIPEQTMLWKTKPTKYLSHMLGHEGKGSLFSRLKERGLATDLCAGQAFDEAGVCFFAVDIQLTEKGEASVPLVGEMLFSYINLLRNREKETSKNAGAGAVAAAAIPEEMNKDSVLYKVFREMQCVDEMSFKFRSLSDPTSAVSGLAQNLQEIEIPPELVLSAHAKIWEYDPALVHETLKHFTLENLQVLRVGKIYADQCTETERWYGTQHSKLLPIEGECLQKWKQPGDFSLDLFHPNPFIAENLEFKKYTGSAKPEAAPARYVLEGASPATSSSSTTPTGASSSANPNAAMITTHMYHKQDQLFRLPKAYLALTLYSPWTSGSAENMMQTEFWSQALAEELNEYSYDAELAGVSYKMGADQRGFYLQVGGYDDKLNVLLAAVSEKIAKTDEISQATYDLIYERFHRELENAATKRQPYHQAMSWRSRLLTKNARTFYEKLKILESIKREDLAGIQRKILGNSYVEGLAMGNLTKDETKRVIQQDFTKKIFDFGEDGAGAAFSPSSRGMSPTAGDPERTPSSASAISKTIAPISTFYFHPNNSVGVRVLGTNPEELNGSSAICLQVGKTSVSTWMKTSLYGQIVGQKFFDELRTKQQLGYIVAHQPVKNSSKVELLYLVQSEVAPSECTKRIVEFCRVMQEEYFNPPAAGTASEEGEKAAPTASTTNSTSVTTAADADTAAPDAEETETAQQKHITEAVFHEYRKALIVQLEEKPKKLSDEFSEHWSEVRERTNDFERRERSIQFLKDLEFSEFLAFAKSISMDNCPGFCVEVVPEKLKEEEMKLPPIKLGGEQMKTWNLNSVEDMDAFLANTEQLKDVGEWLESNTKIDAAETLSKL